MSLLLAVSFPALAADTPSEGAALEFAVESGPDGHDLLLDVGAAGLRHEGETSVGHWFGFHASWDFQGGDGWEIMDRLELSLLEVQRPFEQDRVTLKLIFVDADYDYDASSLDATAFGGGVTVAIFEPYLSVYVGLDLRYRAHVSYWALRDHNALVGIPVTLDAGWQGEIPVFVEGSVGVRPSIGAWGSATFIFEVDAHVAGGYVLLDGEEVDVLIAVRGDYRLDTYAWSSAGGRWGPEPLSEWTGSGGVALRF